MKLKRDQRKALAFAAIQIRTMELPHTEDFIKEKGMLQMREAAADRLEEMAKW